MIIKNKNEIWTSPLRLPRALFDISTCHSIIEGVRAVHGMGHPLVLLEKDEGCYYSDTALTSPHSQTNKLYQTWLPIPTSKILAAKAGNETTPLGRRVQCRQQYQYAVCRSCQFVHLRKESCQVLWMRVVVLNSVWDGRKVYYRLVRLGACFPVSLLHTYQQCQVLMLRESNIKSRCTKLTITFI